jgi:hypothetical protein
VFPLTDGLVGLGLAAAGVGRSVGGGIVAGDGSEGAARGSISLEASVPQAAESVAGANAALASAAAGLDIEEFIPGKPWQGPSCSKCRR